MDFKFSNFFFMSFLLVILCAGITGQENLNKEVKVEEKKEEKKAVVPQYENILDSSNYLHFNLYKDENIESLVLHNSKKTSKTVIYNSNGKTKRLSYNDSFRLSCAEYWKIEKKVSDSRLTKIIYYFSGNENLRTDFKKLKYSTESKEFNFDDKTLIQCYYDECDNLIEKNEYKFLDVPEKFSTSFSKNYKEPVCRKRKDFSFVYKYDDRGQILSEEELHIVYKNESSSIVVRTVTRKNIYEYLKYDCPPVTSFYEDNVLRIKTVYSSEKDYIQNIYFDGDNYVKVEYKNGKKVSEIFYAGGVAY